MVKLAVLKSEKIKGTVLFMKHYSG